MHRDELVQATRASGDPAPLLAAAAELAQGADRALCFALARAFGADVSADPSQVDADGALVLAREHLVRLENDAARRWLAHTTDSAIARELEVWCAVLEGAPVSASSFETLRREARALGRPAAVVELTALEALASSDPALAERLARRGVRMAATEELPESAFLANLVLARLRRLVGRPHLSTHILATLRRYAPPSWHPWLAWELTFAFGRLGASLVPTHATEPTRAIEHASVGVLDAAPALVRADLATLSALADASQPTDDPAVRAFRRGVHHDVPRGLHGLAAVEAHGAVAWVVLERGRPPARILSLGLPAHEAAGRVVLPQSHRHRGRADTLLAACALAGEDGIDEGALFAASYGFTYDVALHGGPFGVTVHRARQRLAEHGSLERAEGIVRLVATSELLLPDPRCAVGSEDRALQHIALGGLASARSIAEALGVSLRSAQQALESLVREGLCGRERDGNAVMYRVEDTTFHEPTQRRPAP